MVAIKYGSQLERIKKDISNTYMSFQPNYERFNKFRRFVFQTTLTEDQKTLLQDLGKPIVEFNIGDAYVSRLMGEFSKNEPSVECRRAGTQKVPPQIISLAEGYIRHVLYEANKSSFATEVYKDCLSGGFSWAKVFTDYESPMSFDQTIGVKRVFNPTLCGGDPLARAPHKGDGRYVFELYPMSEAQFKRQYPGIPVNDISFTRNIQGFSWSYRNGENEGIILLGDFYEKKKKKEKIVKLSNGRVITEDKYERLEAIWQEKGIIEQIPAVIERRKTEIETICRYVVNEKEVIEYKETDFNCFPLVFFRGKSIELSDDTSTGGSTYEFTVPYFYHAEGLQNLKNFSGQTLANGLENMVQHKWIVKKEALPQERDYLKALIDPQHASTLVVNAYSENNPDKPIPEPIIPVTPIPLPPEVVNTFSGSDQIAQAILGSYDAALGINNNQLSGVAIQEAATQTNSAGMPYITGYLQGLTQVANVIIDLIPKYILHPRSLPIVDKKGKTQYMNVNTDDSNRLDYDRDSLQVEVYAGVSYEIQKNQSLQQIISLMSASQAFGQFMNTDGLMILIKNLTIHGQDQLEEMAEGYIKKLQQQQAQAAQMQQQAMQNDPRVITAKAKVMEVQEKAKQNQFENQLRVAEVSIDKQRADNDGMVAEAQVTQEQINSYVQLEKAQTEREVHAMDAAAKLADGEHAKNMDHHESIRKTVELHHNMKQAEKEKVE